MDDAARARLREGATRLGVALDDGTAAAFARYLTLLQRWNARIQLTTVLDADDVVERHFLDSLAIVPVVRGCATLVDVGSGAGFPGAVVALAEPAMRVTLVESVQKKAAFLEAVRRELGLSGVEVCAERMERLVARGIRFDAAVSRATFAPAEWIERGRALLRPGGLLVAMVVPKPAAGLDELVPPRDRARWSRIEELPPYAPGRALVVLQANAAEP